MLRPHQDNKAEVFQLNGRFLIDRGRNEILDRERNESSRLEPRLMKLLCLLADRQGEPVTRELIIKEIWNDYPGASEGLNQAISFLRKQLDDERKEMIRTLPKTGYSLHAVVTASSGNAAGKKNNLRGIKWIAACFGFLCLLSFALYKFSSKEKNISPEYIREAAELSRQDSIHQAERMKAAEDKEGKGK